MVANDFSLKLTMNVMCVIKYHIKCDETFVIKFVYVLFLLFKFPKKFSFSFRKREIVTKFFITCPFI